jgi:Tfp pilus assembly protein PilN
MNNTARNTLVLASLLIVTGAVSYAISGRKHSKLNELKAKNKELTQQIANIRNMMENKEELEQERELQIALASQRSKAIIDIDTPAITYDYLLSLLR